jgi:hypothetical protein
MIRAVDEPDANIALDCIVMLTAQPDSPPVAQISLKLVLNEVADTEGIMANATRIASMNVRRIFMGTFEVLRA